MPQYTAPIQDYTFILKDLLEIEKYQDLEGFSDMDDNLIAALLAEGARFCEEVLFPINQSGDKQGVQFDKGKVTLPDGFVDAYRHYCESGWSSFACEKDYGGQGLPEVLNMAMVEMICSANLSFGIIPGLTHGAYNALLKHGSDALKETYLPQMVSGKWSGVMCLTEPQCGTDLGLITTRAIPDGEAYKISGSKIFISAGDQDASENIIHLVLAKLPDAPDGVKGISLFLVPKFKVNKDGSLGGANAVTCGSIEEKMGIHASPTCVMNYDGAEGYLVGKPHKGLRAMFTMMNEARLYVGVQGLGLAETAYQNSAIYAKERLQGRALKGGAAYPDKKADPLIVHPDVRRMLLTNRCFTEGARALAMYTALQVDIVKKHPDEKARQKADDFINVMTPVIKGYFTDMGTECCNLAMQVYGGHGYIREYGMEQLVRDARIAQIYEGANGVQALDLVGRKLSYKTGRYLRAFFHQVNDFLDAERDNEALAKINKPLYQALGSTQQATLWIAMNGMGDANEAAAGSSEYLRLMGIFSIGYMWAKMAAVAHKKLSEGTDNQQFYQSKLDCAQFYMDKIIPYHYGILASIVSGAGSTMKMDESAF